MKFFDKLGLVIFSLIVLIISIVLCVMIFGWLEISLATSSLKYIVLDSTAKNITLGISIFLMIFTLKCIFFSGYSKEASKSKEGILLENDNGKLMVSRDTIESLTNTVVKSFESAESATTKVEVDSASDIKIYITLFVHPDAVIKDLLNKLQTDVKDTMKKSIDVDVKEVNIRVKNISVKKEIIIKE